MPDTPLPPPPMPRLLISGFYVKRSGFPDPDSIVPFRVMCTNEHGGENPDIPYATILVGGNRDDFPPIRLTNNEYTNTFLPMLNPAVDFDGLLEIDGDLEIDGTWWTGTRDDVILAYQAYFGARRQRRGSAYGGKRHYRKSHKKRSGHKRSGHKSHKRSGRKSGKRSHRRRH